METWMAEYLKQLEIAVREHPEDYGFPVEKVPEVAAKMRVAFGRGSFNKDSRAIKGTCKAFGIKYTYAAINEFLRTHP